MQEKVGEQGRLISPCLKAGALRHILVILKQLPKRPPIVIINHNILLKQFRLISPNPLPETPAPACNADLHR